MSLHEPATRRERPLSRRDLRLAVQAARRARRNTAIRVLVLSALALTTVAAPTWLEFDGYGHIAHAHTGDAPPALAEGSALEVLTQPPPIGDAPSRSLRADPAARLRTSTAELASRSGERAVSDSEANSNLAAIGREVRFVMPLQEDTYRVTSQYGSRTDPFTGAPSQHTGVDMATTSNSPIFAVADGVVDYVGPGKDGRSSMIIVLKHEIDGQTIYTWYNHMYTSGLYVTEGQQVRAGDIIAGVGSNGYSTGPHLHFEVHTDDNLTTTDPLAWLAERDATDINALP